MTTKSTRVPVIAAPIVAILSYYLFTLAGLDRQIAITIAITLLTAIWWVTEALPIPVTSLVPFVLFPAFGVLSHKDVAGSLGAHVIILLMGGCIIAKAIEKSGLHRRIALGLLAKTGGRSGKPLVFAFMLSGALLSMWISNTATCLVLMPIALAVIKQLNDERINVPLVLGIAFSCNLGGMATLIGTPPNLLFAGVYEEVSGAEFSFSRWLGIGLPIVLIGLPLMALWLTRNITAGVRITLPELGQWQSAECRVLAVFCLIIFLWVFRLEPFGGWSGLFGIPKAGDSTVALLGVVLMFLVPSGQGKGEALLDWKTAVDIPWGMLLLFAGGIAIAKAFQVSGTSTFLGESLSGLTAMHPLILIASICFMITFLTDITSNTATTSLFMPVMAAAATAAELPIEVMMIPAAICASCAFMLPVATAPNAIAFGTGLVSVRQMLREGVVLNVMMACLVTLVCYIKLV